VRAFFEQRKGREPPALLIKGGDHKKEDGQAYFLSKKNNSLARRGGEREKRRVTSSSGGIFGVGGVGPSTIKLLRDILPARRLAGHREKRKNVLNLLPESTNDRKQRRQVPPKRALE